MPDKVEVVGGVGEVVPHAVGPAHRREIVGRALDEIGGTRERIGEIGDLTARLARCQCGMTNAAEEQPQRAPVFHHHLAPEHINGLDAIGAFVDRIEAIVAVVLLERMVPRVTRAAEYLNGRIARA